MRNEQGFLAAPVGLILALTLTACDGANEQQSAAEPVSGSFSTTAGLTPPTPTVSCTEASFRSGEDLSTFRVLGWGDLNAAWLENYRQSNYERTCEVVDTSMLALHRDDGGSATFTIDESFQYTVFIGTDGSTPVTGVPGDTVTATDGIIWNSRSGRTSLPGEGTVSVNSSLSLEPATVAEWSNGGSDRFGPWSYHTDDEDVVADIKNFVRLTDEGPDKSPVTIAIPESAQVLFVGTDEYDNLVTAHDGQSVTAIKGLFVHYDDSGGRVAF